MKTRKEKKPRPSNVGRRTGVDVVRGRNIRRQDDGTDVFEDYWTDSESVNSNHTTQSIQSPVKTRSQKISENVSILDRDSVSYRNSPRSSMKRSQRSGEYEDHNGSSRPEASGKKINFSKEIGRRTGMGVIQGKKIRRQDDGTEIYDDYWSDSKTPQSSHSHIETRSASILGNVSLSNKNSVSTMQTQKTFIKEPLNQESGNFEDDDDYSSSEQSDKSKVSREKSHFPLKTMQTSDLLENRQVSKAVNSHIGNSAIGESKMTQTSHLLDELESTPSKNKMHIHNKSRKSNRVDLSDGEINSSVRMHSSEKSARISERSVIQTPDILQNRQEVESISSKSRMHTHNKSRKSSMADLSYEKLNSSGQKYSSENSPTTSESDMMETPDLLENRQVSSTADSHMKTASQNALQEIVSSPSNGHRRSSRYKRPPLASSQNEELEFVKVSTEKEYECVEDHDSYSSPEISESQSKRPGMSRGKSQSFKNIEPSAIARSKMSQNSHLLDEIENTPSKNRMHMHNKSRKSNRVDSSDGEINSSVPKYSTKKSPSASKSGTMPTPDLLENRQEIEGIPSKNQKNIHNKSRKSNMIDLSDGMINSSVQKYPTEKSPGKSKRSMMETPDLLEDRQVPGPAELYMKTASQDVLQEKASPCKDLRKSSRFKIRPLASWRNERLKFVKVSAEKEYECVGVEGGQPEDDFAYRVLKRKLGPKVKKRKTIPWNKMIRKKIPKNIKKTPIFDDNTQETMELYLHRPFSTFEWSLPPNEPGIMISRPFKSRFMSFGYLDIAGHSIKDKQLSPRDNLWFSVVKGVVKVEIYKTSFTFQKGDCFIVPRGTYYSMNNETSSNVLLNFCSFKIPFYKYQEID